MDATVESSRYSWVVLVACTFLQFITDGSLKSFGLFYVEILDEFKGSVSFTTLISGVMLGVYCLSSLPIMLYLLDAITPRGVLILGSILLSVGYSINYISPNIYFLFFSLSVLTGTGMGCIFSPSMYVLGSHFPSKRATYNGIAVSSGSLGVLICPSLYQYLIKSYGLRGAFLLTGGILLHSVPMACLTVMPKAKKLRKLSGGKTLVEKSSKKYIPGSELDDQRNRSLYESVLKDNFSNSHHFCGSDPLLVKNVVKNPRFGIVNMYSRTASESCLHSKISKKKQNPMEYLSSSTNMVGYSMDDLSIPSNSSSNDCEDDAETLSKCSNLSRLLKDSFFLVFLFSNSLSNIVTSTFVPFLPLYAKGKMIDDDKMVILVSLTGAMDLLGRLLCGILADRPYFGSYQILAVSQMICGLALLFNELFTSFSKLVIICVLIGLFSNMHLTLKHSVMVDICGIASYPTALAITTVSQLPLFVIGPYVFGFLRDVSGNFAASFHLTGALAILSSIMFMYIPLVRWCKSCRS